jgi:uncharacterized protein YlxP (DUF503 family)
MFVGLSQFELFIPDSGSLKSKRFVLSSLKARLRNRFNVSVAEVGDTEKWQRVTLGVVTIGNEQRFVDETLAKIYNFVEGESRVQILGYRAEIL